MQMSKGIKRREKAIHSALSRYNAAARALDPPRPTLSFKELTDYAYLANFDILKYSEHGAQGAEWSEPVNRRCVEAWQKIERAKEEIARLNIEIRRVRTHICDEEAFLVKHYKTLRLSDPDLAHALLKHIELTARINQRIQRDLIDIADLEGFTGDLSCATHTAASPIDSKCCPPSIAHTLGALVNNLGDLTLDDDMAGATDDIEPSDEAQHMMIAVEENCKVM